MIELTKNHEKLTMSGRSIMEISKKERRFWKHKFKMRREEYPEHIQHLNLRDEDIDNEALGYLSKRIKTAERLDLDNCLINDEGIAFLKEIDIIKELRLKGINITDKAVPHLNQLTSLTLLHLGGTQISCAGVAGLTGLKQLKTLLFSPNDIENDKLSGFLKALPQCELIINHRIYNP